MKKSYTNTIVLNLTLSHVLKYFKCHEITVHLLDIIGHILTRTLLFVGVVYFSSTKIRFIYVKEKKMINNLNELYKSQPLYLSQ